jgi:hypothetical protein
MKPNAHIICHSRPIGLGSPPHITYQWEGGDVLAMSGGMGIVPALPGYTFWIGPYCLRAIEYQYQSDTTIAVRERPIKARAYAALYTATCGLDWMYRRAVLTLAVWGLARYDQGRVPSWRDVKGTARLQAWTDARHRARLLRRIERLQEQFKEKP